MHQIAQNGYPKVT